MRPAKLTRRATALAVMVLLGACSSSPARQDKQNVQKARSLLAEWAMLSENHAAGRLTETYYGQMRSEADKQLTSLAAVAPQSGTAAGHAIAEAAQVHGEPAVALLRVRAAAAEAIENSLEGR